MSIIDEYKKYLNLTRTLNEDVFSFSKLTEPSTINTYCSRLKDNKIWEIESDANTNGVFIYDTYDKLEKEISTLKEKAAKNAANKRYVISALNNYAEFLMNARYYIDIFANKVNSNIPEFDFSWNYMCEGGSKKSPTYINLKKAFFISGDYVEIRHFEKKEQRESGIVLSRLAIQVFESDLDSLTEVKRRSIKTDGTNFDIGIWSDKDALHNRWGANHANPGKNPYSKRVRDDYLNNAYPSKENAKYYFYNLGLFDSIHMAQSLMQKFGNEGCYFRIYVSQGQQQDNMKTNVDLYYETDSNCGTEAKEPVNNLHKSQSVFLGKGENIIFYGIPGSGKSFSIQSTIDKIAHGGSYRVYRMVFHPDYTYSDFVGQILPTLNQDKVVYQFKPGPFTQALRFAKINTDVPVFLIIEEINRGNAAAIFGDIFQLLDRNDKGESEYEITNQDISENPVKIPSNLYIFATMNTSDQNVFTLDTAFQRRFDMELIRNYFTEEQNWEIDGTGVKWKLFAERVNRILAKQDVVMSSEDKSIGAWFVKKNISKDRFAGKVLKYLWDDAFKFDRAAFFQVDLFPTLQGILDEFEKTGFENILTDCQELQDVLDIAKQNNTLKQSTGGDNNVANEN
jgi:hypothetical protein